MTRKATFSPKKPKKNSSDHNSRKEMPKYLIEEDPNFLGNYYERIPPYENDEQFKELAKQVYNEKFLERTGQNQKMQQKQVDALIKEVVITIERHHTIKDILQLFVMLRLEKAKVNNRKRLLKKSFLKPSVLPLSQKLPKKWKIKRKPKKENLNETGYHILELAGHYDEGHFKRIGKWEGLSYYPSRDILLKDDGKWYIKSDELSERTDEEAFDVLADMSEFVKVYNYHWHVKFTHFNLETGLSANFAKGEISGEGRLKKVAEHLGLRYVPEEKIPLDQGVKSIKEQHHVDRQNKYRQLMMKFEHIDHLKKKDAKIRRGEEHLSKQVTDKHRVQKNVFNLQNNIDVLQEKIEEQKVEIAGLGLQIEELETKNEQEAQLRNEKEKNIENAEIAFIELKKEFDSITEKLNKITSEKLILERKFERLEEANNGLNNKIDKLEKANSEYVENIQKKEKENEELKKTISGLEGLVYSDKVKTGKKLTYKRLAEISDKKIKYLSSLAYTGHIIERQVIDENTRELRVEKWRETWKSRAQKAPESKLEEANVPEDSRGEESIDSVTEKSNEGESSIDTKPDDSNTSAKGITSSLEHEGVEQINEHAKKRR